MSDREKCWWFVWGILIALMLCLTAYTGAADHPGWAIALLVLTWATIAEAFKGPPA